MLGVELFVICYAKICILYLNFLTGFTIGFVMPNEQQFLVWQFPELTKDNSTSNWCVVWQNIIANYCLPLSHS
jgi:hypothetical protein